MNICRDCKHWAIGNKWVEPFGFCGSEKWHGTYHADTKKLLLNEIVTECDEGWCAYVGPEFGCIHWEQKP